MPGGGSRHGCHADRRWPMRCDTWRAARSCGWCRSGTPTRDRSRSITPAAGRCRPRRASSSISSRKHFDASDLPSGLLAASVRLGIVVSAFDQSRHRDQYGDVRSTPHQRTSAAKHGNASRTHRQIGATARRRSSCFFDISILSRIYGHLLIVSFTLIAGLFPPIFVVPVRQCRTEWEMSYRWER